MGVSGGQGRFLGGRSLHHAVKDGQHRRNPGGGSRSRLNRRRVQFFFSNSPEIVWVLRASMRCTSSAGVT